jgi:two-component system C4-dicarboxylate transport sensor histidine kinase DctB
MIRISAPDAGMFLSQTTMLPEYGWTIHRLTELTTVDEDQRDGGIIGGSLSALIIILALYVVQRHQAYLAASRSGIELQRQVAERTHELSDSNASLQTEIEERRRTERGCAQPRTSWCSGKLAALGQMSAAIAHDQPAAAAIPPHGQHPDFRPARRGRAVARNLDLITDLAERMASITGHLKTLPARASPAIPGGRVERSSAR